MTRAVNTGRAGRIDPGVDYGSQYNYTTSTALDADQDGALITNLGATAAVVITLPAAVAGREFAFAGLADYAFTVAAAGTDTISTGAAAGTYAIEYDNTVVIGCYVDGAWDVVIEPKNPPTSVSLADFPMVGDGSADDTADFQAALTYASNNNLTLLFPISSNNYKITGQVYLWGGCSLRNENDSYPGTVTLNIATDIGRAFVFGVSAPLNGGTQYLEEPWYGEIVKINFTGAGVAGPCAILWFVRTNGGLVSHNIVNTGNHAFSFTGSGSQGGLVLNAGYLILKNIRITYNEMTSTTFKVSFPWIAGESGSDGIGLDIFDGFEIANNIVNGTSDDCIAVHYCTNGVISGNHCNTTIGALIIQGCKNVEVTGNVLARTARVSTGVFYGSVGVIKLIPYIDPIVGASGADQRANCDINIHDNSIYFPLGADDYSAIYVTGGRRLNIQNNSIVSDTTDAGLTSIFFGPFTFTGDDWTDPEGIDPVGLIMSIRDVKVTGNNCTGRYPAPIYQGGGYAAAKYHNIIVTGNTAPSVAVFGADTTVAGHWCTVDKTNVITRMTTSSGAGAGLVMADGDYIPGQTFTNRNAAAAAWNYNLPEALVGLEYHFFRENAGVLTVTSTGTNSINAVAAPPSVLTINDQWTKVTLTCEVAGAWIVSAVSTAAAGAPYGVV